MGDPAGHRVWPPAGSKRDEDGRTVRFERETGGEPASALFSLLAGC